MPLSAAATNTAVDDNVKNPDQNQSRTIVHATLIFDGVTFVPDNLYDALDLQYGTVSTEKDDMARGTYIFKISA